MEKFGSHRDFQLKTRTRGQGRVNRHASHARGWRPFPRLREERVADGQLAAFSSHDASNRSRDTLNRSRDFLKYAGLKPELGNRFGPLIGPNSGEVNWAGDCSTSLGSKKRECKRAQLKPNEKKMFASKAYNPLAHSQNTCRNDNPSRSRKDKHLSSKTAETVQHKTRMTNSIAFSRISQAFDGTKVSDRDAVVLRKRRGLVCNSGVVWKASTASEKGAESYGVTVTKKKKSKRPVTKMTRMIWTPKPSSHHGSFRNSFSTPSSEPEAVTEHKEDDYMGLIKTKPLLRRRQKDLGVPPCPHHSRVAQTTSQLHRNFQDTWSLSWTSGR